MTYFILILLFITTPYTIKSSAPSRVAITEHLLLLTAHFFSGPFRARVKRKLRLCSTFYALRSMFYVLCSTFYVLLSMFYSQCSIFHCHLGRSLEANFKNTPPAPLKRGVGLQCIAIYLSFEFNILYALFLRLLKSELIIDN